MQNVYKQKVVKFFNRRIAYDSEGASHPREARRLFESVPLKAGQTILDIATGTGLVAIPAAKIVAPRGSVIGVDISSGMLAQARQKMIAESVQALEFIEADIETMNFAPQQFDVIFCCSALVYICDIRAILKQCHSWLKPNGCFAFTTPTQHSHQAELKVTVCQEILGIDLPHIIRPLWTEAQCRIRLQQAGFQSIEIETHLYSRSQLSQDASPRLEEDFYPRGNPLLELSKKQLEDLNISYQKALGQLISEQGIWQDNTSLLIRAWK